jgi:AdoMet-dependent heme synthase
MENKEYFSSQWHITDRCNLRCKHCYQNSPDNYKDMSIENWITVANIFDQLGSKWGMDIDVALTGGEPFTRRKDLFCIIDHIEQKNNIKSFDILSNGLMITNDDISFLKTKKKLKRIQISLEGHNEALHDSIRGTGSLSGALKAIKLLKENNINVSVMMTLSKRNYKYIENVYDLLVELKVDAFAVDRFIPERVDNHGFNNEVLSREEIQEAFTTYLRLNDKHKCSTTKLVPYKALFCLLGDETENEIGAACSAGKSALDILPDGTILPCRRLPIPLGNILKDNIYEIWFNNEVLWSLRNTNNLKGKCNGCDYLYKCGGCRAMALAVSGDYLEEDPLCWKN